MAEPVAHAAVDGVVSTPAGGVLNSQPLGPSPALALAARVRGEEVVRVAPAQAKTARAALPSRVST